MRAKLGTAQAITATAHKIARRKLQLEQLRNAGRRRHRDVASFSERNTRLNRDCGGTRDRRHAERIAICTFDSGWVLPALWERSLVMGSEALVQLPGYPIDGRERRRPSVRIVHRPRNQQD